MDKISIIMPIYNAEAFLAKTITSLIEQTFTDIEIICINDGSKDSSLQILYDFAKKDSRIKIFDQENSGPAKARNVGLENSTGKYIMFCDADDWYEGEMCQVMYDAMETKDIDFAMCDTNIIDEIDGLDRGDSISYYRLPYQGMKKLINYKEKDAVNALLWNKIFKKECIDKYNITFPNGCFHDDDAFVFQYLCASSNAYFIDKQLYNYFRRKNESIMATYFAGNQTSTDRGKIAQFVCKKLQNNGLISSNNDSYLLFFLRQSHQCYNRLEPSLQYNFMKEQYEFIINSGIETSSNDPELNAQFKRMAFFAQMPHKALLTFYERQLLTRQILNILTLGLCRGLKKKISKLKAKIKYLKPASL